MRGKCCEQHCEGRPPSGLSSGWAGHSAEASVRRRLLPRRAPHQHAPRLPMRRPGCRKRARSASRASRWQTWPQRVASTSTARRGQEGLPESGAQPGLPSAWPTDVPGPGLTACAPPQRTLPVPLPTPLRWPCPACALQDCWSGYVQTAIDSGPSCLDLRCPDPGGCCAVLPGCTAPAATSSTAAQPACQLALASLLPVHPAPLSQLRVALSWVCRVQGCSAEDGHRGRCRRTAQAAVRARLAGPASAAPCVCSFQQRRLSRLLL